VEEVATSVALAAEAVAAAVPVEVGRCLFSTYFYKN
jgi:hypothetical protein